MPKFPTARTLLFARPAAAASIALLVLLMVTGCGAVRPTKGRVEDITLYDFSSAMRWGDFDAAYDFVDPKTKVEHPLTDIDRGRFKQLEVSAYEVIAKKDGEGTVDQQVKLELINRNTQLPRSITYHEHWRWDDTSQHWWLVSGLPDLSPQD